MLVLYKAATATPKTAETKAPQAPTFPLLRSLPSHPSTREAAALIRIKAPALFKGEDLLDFRFIQKLRTRLHALNETQRLLQRLPLLRSALETLRIYLRDNHAKETPVREVFDRELNDKFMSGNFAPLPIFGLALRYAAAISDVFDDERNFFKTRADSHIFQALSHDAWVNELGSYQAVQDSLSKLSAVDYKYSHKPNLDSAIDDLIDKELIKYLAPNIFYPLLGLTTVGIVTLFECNLQNIYPIAIAKPYKTTKVHGMDLSPLGLAVHDVAHANIDHKLKKHATGELIKDAASKFVARGGDAAEFTKYYTPYAVEKLRLLTGAIAQINIVMQQILVPKSRTSYREAMAGLFLLMHEAPNYYSVGSNDLERIIEDMAKHVQDMFERKHSTENEFDLYHTSPETGQSSLSDEEIIQMNKARIIQSFSGDYVEGAIGTIAVLRSAKFIDLNVKFRNGQEIEFREETLFHKWQNLDDSLALLKFAGFDIKKPRLMFRCSEMNRSTATEFLRIIRLCLNELVNNYAAKAKYFMHLRLNDQPSVAERYALSINEIDAKVFNESKKMLAKPRPRFF